MKPSSLTKNGESNKLWPLAANLLIVLLGWSRQCTPSFVLNVKYQRETSYNLSNSSHFSTALIRRGSIHIKPDSSVGRVSGHSRHGRRDYTPPIPWKSLFEPRGVYLEEIVMFVQRDTVWEKYVVIWEKYACYGVDKQIYIPDTPRHRLAVNNTTRATLHISSKGYSGPS